MSLQTTPFIVLDTETTGLDPAQDRVVQLALVGVRGQTVVPLLNRLVNPGRPIPARATAIHGFTDAMVADAPSLRDIGRDILRYIRQVPVVVAHNAAFDQAFVPDTGKPWLCTKRLSQHLWPDAPNYQNQGLRAWLGIEVDGDAHNAAGDAMVTGHILIRLIVAYLEQGGEDSVEALVAFANAPILVNKMPFGKYAGVPIGDVPESYLRWALEKLDRMDATLRASIERVLARKAESA